MTVAVAREMVGALLREPPAPFASEHAMRHIVQIAAIPAAQRPDSAEGVEAAHLFALATDGTCWVLELTGSTRWVRLPALPSRD